MKIVSTILLVILLSAPVFSQKGMQRIIDASEISTIDVAGNTIFKIKISAKPVQVITMSLQVEGENNEQIVLQTRHENQTLFIGSAYQPLFVKPDDKLAAHKKISIELTLEIPENLTVIITSDIASVVVIGNYKFLIAELLNGHFSAHKYSGDLQVDTLHGNIELETRSGKLDLNTKKGTIVQDKMPLGTNQISLNSINGNISVTKTQ
ncbi:MULTISPECIES: DUF4097 family beta strand repeat-containing protein [Bizionia]|uniref:DUF4097 domain-containing protein n=1 Tax=Bizionia algoritergicola TaxID=291187 RepID=A0A5D0R1F9_9FLAO|nr:MULTISPECIES: hypothetical protein [Bizionia]OBX23546.1 hypothetical protein BAA08_04130 [Bizionia sp. APA-3]TYB74919.1 hypothetical protein ES675_01935 [Bizionia algoritergicola]